MTFTYRHKKEIIIGVLGIALLLVLILFFFFKIQFSKDDAKEGVVMKTTNEKLKEDSSNNDEAEEYYQVDIKGEVNTPGIYTVKKGSRVIDVIRLAGDLTVDADTSVLNLSKKVTDEMVIIVYSYDEVVNFTATKEKEQEEQSACINQSEIINGACIENDSTKNSVLSDSKVSLNEASLEELMTLSGIGEAKAKSIIKYREEVGPFQTIEDLKEVEGIGDTIFDQIKENITT